MRRTIMGVIAAGLVTMTALAQVSQFVYTIDSNNTDEYTTLGGLLIDNAGNTGVLFYHLPDGAFQQVPAVAKLNLAIGQTIFSDTINNLPTYIVNEVEEINGTFWMV